ncbi:MAG: UDP-N-acetyl-alpha-D-glucosamine C6 dehydratase [Verrucomicrobiae bacterium]|nr:UDP-N-acetyl-alpha-D-glucosamine C6 dehydratase [Verrucomicrobiae bacterium]
MNESGGESSQLRKFWHHEVVTVARALWERFPSHSRIPVALVTYFVGLTVSLWLAYLLRYDFYLPPEIWQQFCRVAFWLIPLQLASLLVIGQFAGLLSYFGVPDLRRLALTLGAAFVTTGIVYFKSDGELAPPPSVMVADLVISFGVLCSIRLFCRRVREIYTESLHLGSAIVRRVGILGAGDAGAALACELLSKPRLGLRPVLFLDDDTDKHDSRIHDIRVMGAPELLMQKAKEWKLDKIIIAMPSAPVKRIQALVKMLAELHLDFATIPSMGQLATGRVQVSQIRPVDITDLLGREPVELQMDNIRGLLQDRVVLVTGAGGSIGSELCRQIVTYQPQSLVLVEQSEGQMFQIEQELRRSGHGDLVIPQIGNILDDRRMREIFAQFQPAVVFHAAAHKHVPLMESHPAEAIKNNSFGTVKLARLAVEFNVQRFVLISTDKAINPTSVMGATKRLAEIFLQSLAANNGHQTKFMAVRFGNVLDSSGSVVPIFKQQIAAGGPVTVTHPEVTRYFMTIPEAVSLVLQSATQGLGGEIFVLDMGQPVKIVDLARQLIELSGLKPDEDIAIQFVGLRPGEKLFEEISHDGENIQPTNHSKIMRFVSPAAALDWVEETLARMEGALHSASAVQLKRLLKRAIPEYQLQPPSDATPQRTAVPELAALKNTE